MPGPSASTTARARASTARRPLATWDVLAQDETSCELETHLLTAPLRLRRSVSVAGDTLTVTDEIENLSPDAVETRIVQHPAFGAPFLDGESYVVTSAAKIVTDADAPGSLAGADVVGRPDEVLASGTGPRQHPAPRPRLGCFAVRRAHRVRHARGHVLQPDAGARRATRRGMAAILPHAWFWIEANAGSGWPWFRRLYAIAVEPANVLPGEGGTPAHPRGGTGTRRSPAGGSITLTTSLTRLALPRD